MENSNNQLHIAKPWILSVGAYTASDNIIHDEVGSALGLSLRHLQRNIPIVSTKTPYVNVFYISHK